MSDSSAPNPESTETGRSNALFGLPPGPVSERIAQQRASERMILLVVRALFLVMLATVTTLTIASRAKPEDPAAFSTTTMVGIIISTMSVGVIVLAVDYMTPNKRLAAVVGVYLGICVGLLGAVAIAKLIDVVASAWTIEANVFIDLAKVVVGIILCYLAVSFVLTTKDNFRLVIPYVEFAKQVRGIRPMALDTSVLVDGRIEQMVQSGFIDAPLVIPIFVIEELQRLSDSGDRLKRTRGRRGLDVVSRLQTNGVVEVSIEDIKVPGHSVDRMLVELANNQQMRLLTTDFNLVKVARINGASALNLNDLAQGLKTIVGPGETLNVEIVKEGENEGQGVGYMPDGTMVVVEFGAQRLGETVETVVTNSLQTSAGRLVFAKIENGANSNIEAVASSATTQPRFPGRPDRDPSESRPPRRNNPRRSSS